MFIYNFSLVHGFWICSYITSFSRTYMKFRLWFLSLQRDVVAAYLEGGKPADEEGAEDAFELLHEVNERVRTGIWVGDCFIYNNSSWRLNYCVGGEVKIVCSELFFFGFHVLYMDILCDTTLFPYIVTHSIYRSPQCITWIALCIWWDILRIKVEFILLTRSLSAFAWICLSSYVSPVVAFLLSVTNTLAPCSVIGYTLLLSLIEYKTLVMRGDLESANEILPSIPKTQYNRLVSVFDTQG